MSEETNTEQVEQAADAQSEQSESTPSIDQLMGQLSQLTESVNKLEANNKALVNEKKAEAEKRKAAEESARLAQMEKDKEEGNFKALFEAQQAENKRLTDAMSERDKEKAQVNKFSFAEKQALSVSKQDANRTKMLASLIDAQLQEVDGEYRVTDSKGNLTVSTVEQLMQQLSETHSFLFDGNGSTGSGAVGGVIDTPAETTNKAATEAKKKGDVVGYLNAAMGKKVNK